MLSIEEAKKNWTISFQKEVYKLVRKNDRKRTQLVERTRAQEHTFGIFQEE